MQLSNIEQIENKIRTESIKFSQVDGVLFFLNDTSEESANISSLPVYMINLQNSFSLVWKSYELDRSRLIRRIKIVNFKKHKRSSKNLLLILTCWICHTFFNVLWNLALLQFIRIRLFFISVSVGSAIFDIPSYSNCSQQSYYHTANTDDCNLNCSAAYVLKLKTKLKTIFTSFQQTDFEKHILLLIIFMLKRFCDKYSQFLSKVCIDVFMS